MENRIMESNIEFKFDKNGFYFKHEFFAYQAIAVIYDLTFKYKYLNVFEDDFCLDKNKEEYSAIKYWYFNIELTSGEIFTIKFNIQKKPLYINHKIKFYEVLAKRYSLWQWIFQDGYVINPELGLWEEDKNDNLIEQDFNYIKQQRELLITHFNEWKKD